MTALASPPHTRLTTQIPRLDSASPALKPTPPPARGRTLHLIDLENLVAGKPTRANLRSAWEAYRRDIVINERDRVRIAVAYHLVERVNKLIPTGRQLLAASREPDAADRALIDSVDVDFTADRFKNVVIASGDGIFAPLAEALVAVGCPVTVAYWAPISCSRQLRAAGATDRRLQYPLVGAGPTSH